MRSVESDFHLDLAEFDTFQTFRLVREAGGAIGFDNVDDPCFLTTLGVFAPACEEGANFDSFVFFDEIHPTARVHAIIGMAMFAVVSDAFEIDDDDEEREDDEDEPEDD